MEGGRIGSLLLDEYLLRRMNVIYYQCTPLLIHDIQVNPRPLVGCLDSRKQE